jgi:UDPglucose 6-dehydrogenase
VTSISIVGTGYVGLAYAVAFASLGHDVVGVDIDDERVDTLNSGRSPIFEPGLEPLLLEGLAAERLRFTTHYDEGLAQANLIFICVSTPSMSGGDADLRSVRSAAVAIGARLPLGRRVVIVNKSTMPIGSADLVVQLVGQSAPVGALFGVVSNPEFLREGAAIADVFRPDRIVLGSNEQWAIEALTALYEPMGAPILVTDRRSAELIKYAANAFLATKISFINEVAQISERLGADITTVARGIGLDRRIGPLHLQAGLGFGGSCFPKDVMALARIAARSDLHPQLLHAVMEINADQRRRFVDRTERLLGGSLEGRVIAMLGLAFKEDTDDIRDSPAIDVATMLMERGAAVRAYDPKAMQAAARGLPAVEMRLDAYAAADAADAVLVVTPWAEFRNIDLQRLAKAMRGDLLMDGRNLFDPAEVMRAGLRYAGIGRGVFANRSEPVAAARSDRDGAPAAS